MSVNINNLWIQFHRPIRYLAVGGFSYLLEMAVLYFLKKMGLDDIIAVGLSFWVGFITAFTLQKIITFQSRSKNIKSVSKQLILYSLLVVFNYIFTIIVVGIFSDKYNVYTLRSIVIIMTTFWNYLIYRYIFADI
jgi:putative flippase GtrA